MAYHLYWTVLKVKTCIVLHVHVSDKNIKQMQSQFSLQYSSFACFPALICHLKSYISQVEFGN